MSAVKNIWNFMQYFIILPDFVPNFQEFCDKINSYCSFCLHFNSCYLYILQAVISFFFFFYSAYVCQSTSPSGFYVIVLSHIQQQK